LVAKRHNIGVSAITLWMSAASPGSKKDSDTARDEFKIAMPARW